MAQQQPNEEEGASSIIDIPVHDIIRFGSRNAPSGVKMVEEFHEGLSGQIHHILTTVGSSNNTNMKAYLVGGTFFVPETSGTTPVPVRTMNVILAESNPTNNTLQDYNNDSQQWTEDIPFDNVSIAWTPIDNKDRIYILTSTKDDKGDLSDLIQSDENHENRSKSYFGPHISTKAVFAIVRILDGNDNQESLDASDVASFLNIHPNGNLMEAQYYMLPGELVVRTACISMPAHVAFQELCSSDGTTDANHNNNNNNNSTLNPLQQQIVFREVESLVQHSTKTNLAWLKNMLATIQAKIEELEEDENHNRSIGKIDFKWWILGMIALVAAVLFTFWQTYN